MYSNNFNIPLPPTIETTRVKLTPFIPSTHGETFFSAFQADPNLARHLPVSFPTYLDFISLIEKYILSEKNSFLFTIIDKTKSEDDEKKCIAGIIGLLGSSPQNRAIEIGPVIILTAFQRTFVSSNAIGAILKYLLDVPSEGGLGFRRVTWTASPLNQASIRAAERMGLRREGVLRWAWCLPPDKEGRYTNKERGDAPGRDSVLLAICWDDWENGAKEKVEQLIQRV